MLDRKFNKIKKAFITLSILFCLGTVGCGTETTPKSDRQVVGDIIPFLDTKVVLVGREEASKLLATSDEFTQSLSPFDVSSRLRDKSKTSEQDYLDFAAAQAKDWTVADKKNLNKIISSAASKIEKLGLQLNFPEEIKILNSTREEENEAAYTRSNFIVMEGDGDEGLFLHELFHVYSRANPDKRDALYGTIGFLPNQRIIMPEAIQPTKATNPDAPFMEHYINVVIDGESTDATFVTQAREPYNGGSFFEYLTPKLLVLEAGGASRKPKIVDGDPVLKDYSEAENLFEKIGTNTQYTIHPEEIMAMHFTFLVIGEDVAEPEYLERAANILREQ